MVGSTGDCNPLRSYLAQNADSDARAGSGPRLEPIVQSEVKAHTQGMGGASQGLCGCPTLRRIFGPRP